MASIKDRTKKAVNEGAPSLNQVPAQIPAPPPREEEVIPSVTDIVKDRKDLLSLRRLMNLHIELSRQASEIDKERDKVVIELKKLVGKHQIGKADYDGDRINYYASERKTIKPERLLAAGVQPQVIQAATDVSTSYTLRITAGKGEKSED